jgi:hypothetical protein
MSSLQLPISPRKSAKKSARTQRPHSDFSFSLTDFSKSLNFFFFLTDFPPANTRKKPCDSHE